MKNNWQTKKLGELCNTFTDGNWIERKDQSSGGIRLIQTGNIGNGVFKDRDEKARYVSENTFRRLRCTEIFPDDCLISRLPDPVGRACIIPDTGEKMITAVDCTIIRFKKEEILSRWFMYYSLSQDYQNQINRQVSGATRQRISRNNLGLIEIPLTKFSIQRRIVKILDEVFEGIAKIEENSEKNLQNSREFFESFLQSVFANPGDGWGEKKLKEVAEIFGGFAFKSGQFMKAGKYQVIRMGNVRPGLIRIDENPVFIDKIDEKSLSRSLLRRGDIIITQTGTRKKRDYGYTVAIDKDNYLLNQRLAAIRCSKNLNHRFFLYFSWSNKFRDQFFANETGTVGQGNVGIGAVTGALIPIPKIEVQKCVVAKLDTLFAETKRLEAIYQQKLTDSEEMKKSILQKAFKGELVGV